MKRVRLEEIFEIERGGSPRPIKKFITKSPDGINWIKISDTNESKYITQTKEKIIQEGVKKSRFVTPGDFLLTNSMSFGRPYILKIEGCIHDGWLVLRPKEDDIFEDYAYYILGSPTLKREFEKQAKGTTVKNLNISLVSKVEIPLPSLSEQKEIVAKLDRAQRLIDIDRQMLAKYDELIQSVFLEMFGDPKSNSNKIKTGNLGEYAFISMGQSPKGSSYNEEGDGEPLLNGPTEFGEKYPKEKQWTTEPKKFAEEDDILFCVRGATAGRTNLADKKYCIGRGLAAIRGEEKLDTTFIYFVLKSHYDYFQNQGQGSTFINIAKKDLSNLEVPIPTKELQHEFVSVSKEIEIQKRVTKASLKKSEELFSSLVQGAFN